MAELQTKAEPASVPAPVESQAPSLDAANKKPPAPEAAETKALVVVEKEKEKESESEFLFFR